MKTETNKILKKVYNDTIEIFFYPNPYHKYRLVGQKDWLISVTACTGMINKADALVNWAVNKCCIPYIKRYLDEVGDRQVSPSELYPVLEQASKQHDEEKKKASGIGKDVHDYAEAYGKFKLGFSLKLPDFPADNKALNGINAFIDWTAQHKVKFHDVERLVYSKKHGFVGIADAIATVDGKKYLVDYKTGSGIYNEYYLQVSGYLLAYEEETGEKLDGGLILRFDKETGELDTPRIIGRDDHKKNAKAFLACYEIKKRDKELNKLTYKKKG